MKSLVFVFAVALGAVLFSCSNKKAAENTDAVDSSAVVIDYGSVAVDSVSADSVEVTVADTTVVLE